MLQTNTLKPIDAIIVAEAAKGEPCRAIAQKVDKHFTTVNRITNKHKELIQSEQAKLVEQTLSKITDRAIKEINHAQTLDSAALMDKDNQQALARIDKKEEMILKSVGIAPSHAPSIHVQQIFNDNRKTILNPNVATLLHGQLNDIIDGEIIEDEESDNE